MNRRAKILRDAVLVAGLLLGPSERTSAARLQTWIETPGQLVQGRAEGMALTARGRLLVAPRSSRVGGFADGRTEPAQIWAEVRDAAGNVYLATGPEGQILKIATGGQQSILYQVEEPLVTALVLGPDGNLLAGTGPGGRIYSVSTTGKGKVWVETEETYVWSLVVSPDGSIYAGTGDRGRVLAIDRSGRVEVFLDTDEAHIVSLVALPDRTLLAGGAGRGVVYAIDAEARARVLHDDDLPEVAALAVGPDGAVFAALVAFPELTSRRPVFELRMPDVAEPVGGGEPLATLEDSPAPTLQGFVEGLARSGEGPGRSRGRVVRIDRGGEASELWSSASEAPLCITTDAEGAVVFGTGEPARLYRVEADGDVALLLTSKEAQVTRLLTQKDGVLLVSTSNPAATYRVEKEAAEFGLFVSRAFDAGGPARWGSLRWSVEPGSDRTELYTRTGNSVDPDSTWSDWSKALTDPEGSAIANPDGRFLQWRLRQTAGRGARSRLSSVAVTYAPYNRQPRFDEFRLEGPNAAAGGPMTFVWTVHDPDDDPIQVMLEYRLAGSVAWGLALEDRPETSGWPGAHRVGRGVWETAEIPEGDYQIRAVASDQPGNPPGEGHLAPAPELLAVTVDRTPPRLQLREIGPSVVEVEVEDVHSGVRGLELLLDGTVRASPRALDGLSDARRERFRVDLPDPGAGGAWTVRGVDAAGNVAERALETAKPR